MKWLITGGCGFIGTSLIKHLRAKGGHTVRVIDNLSVGTREDLSKATEFIETDAAKTGPLHAANRDGMCELVVGNILDEALALKVCAGADVIVHLAANTGVAPSVQDPMSDCMNNVIGTLNYLESARQNSVKRFVFASSGAPVGECTPPIHEELPCHPVSPYGASKLAGEAYCSAYCRTFGIETIVLRFGNVYGPGSGHKNSVIAKFIKQAMNGETLEIYGDGSQTRDFIYIYDLVAAIYKAATLHQKETQSLALSPQSSSIAGEVFQIATHSETTVGELADVLMNILNIRGVGPVKAIHGAPRQGDVSRNYSDTTKAEKYLNWKAEVNLEQGLKQTVDWFFSNGIHRQTQ